VTEEMDCSTLQCVAVCVVVCVTECFSVCCAEYR